MTDAVRAFMDKKAVAQVLEQIAAFLELKGENPFRIRAFRTAARAVGAFSGDLREGHVLNACHDSIVVSLRVVAS